MTIRCAIWLMIVQRYSDCYRLLGNDTASSTKENRTPLNINR